MTEIVFATGNAGKAREVAMMFSDMDVCVKTLKEADIHADIIEDGKTFMENARIKAKTIARFTDKIVLADDSGLVIDYLNGEPGIYSARYMGEDTSYDIKNANILKRMENVPTEERTARFICAMAAVMPDGEVIEAEGVMEGIIGTKSAGTNGFGYDPIFYLPEYEASSAEITPEQKNEISHRGKALRKMQEELRKRIQG
ncbi:MAG: XTP/dITP diphosphatase [Lachnospiraceae bacterium]|nr:XTP/dITP diphosphatase [Lachnospiraceae bacterium]